jgi:3-hydroxybutyryl-CoA dehydrogenase
LTDIRTVAVVGAGAASAEDIIRAMTLGHSHPVGPLRLTDMVGPDVRLAIARYRHRKLGERFAPPPVLEGMVAEGRLGRKRDQGFFRGGDP